MSHETEERQTADAKPAQDVLEPFDANPTREPATVDLDRLLDAKQAGPRKRDEPEPVVVATPGERHHKLRLGAKHRQQYTISGVAPKARVQWRHRIEDEAERTSEGRTTTIDVVAASAGTTAIDAEATVDRRTLESPQIRLFAPGTPTQILNARTKSRDRSIPFARQMHADEDLVMSVRLPELDEGIEHSSATFETPSMAVIAVRHLGPQTFEVILRPTTIGKIAGRMTVLPRGVRSGAQPAELELEVLAKGDLDDYGTRPLDTAGAVEQVKDAWRSLYERRIEGLYTFSRQLEEKEIEEPSFLKQLLESAAMIALSATTGGVGQALVAKVAHPAWQEFHKVLIEQTSQAVIEGGVRKALSSSDGSQRKRTAGGTLLNLKTYFVDAQSQVLRDARDEHAKRVASSMKAKAERLDRENPGDGYRFALATVAAVEGGYVPAQDLQYRECIQSYATLMAGCELGTVDDDPAPEKRRDGTDLKDSVDVEKIVIDSNLVKPGLDDTPGVLRLKLYKSGVNSLKIAKAHIEGFDNDTILDGLARKPLKELHMPVVASFEENLQDGFVIGRNENRRFFADSNSDALLGFAPGRTSEVEAAKYILDHVIGDHHVKAKRG